MKNKISIMLNTLKDYNINLSMFIKIVDDKTAMILLARKEEINIDNDLLCHRERTSGCISALLLGLPQKGVHGPRCKQT